MVRGERKQPIWSTIPVPGVVTAKRDGFHSQRKELAKKRQLEEEEEKRKRKEQEQIAKILAARWAQEDIARKGGYTPAPQAVRPDDSDDEEAEEEGGWVTIEAGRGRSPEPRRKRPAEERDDARRDREESDRRDRDRSRHAADLEAPSRSGASSSTGGGAAFEEETRRWFTEEAPPREQASSRPPPEEGRRLPQSGITSVQTAIVVPKARKKVPGVFGLSDSDEERQSCRREMELARSSKQRRLNMQSGQSNKLAVAEGGGPGGRRPGESIGNTVAAASGMPASGGLMTAEVHMKYAQWKQSCKNRYVEMPDDLRKAIDIVMGSRT